jgi:hypothetical protein
MSEFRSMIKDGASSAWQKTLRIVKRIALLLAVLGVLSGLAYYGFGNMTYSSGSRSGQIIKLSHKGILFKTYEGELFLGVYTPSQPSFAPGNVWSFSVLKKDVYQQIQALEGKQVKLFYKEHYRSFPWQGETRYFIYKAEAILN